MKKDKPFLALSYIPKVFKMILVVLKMFQQELQRCNLPHKRNRLATTYPNESAIDRISLIEE